MKKYASKFLAIVSLLSLFLQSAYPVILAYEHTDPGSGTSCTLSVDRTSVTQGDSVTYTISSSSFGYSAYWRGNENGQSVNAPVEEFSQTNYWSKTYPLNEPGTYSNYIEILDEEGSVICTTNTVTVAVAPLNEPIPSPSGDPWADYSGGINPAQTQDPDTPPESPTSFETSDIHYEGESCEPSVSCSTSVPNAEDSSKPLYCRSIGQDNYQWVTQDYANSRCNENNINLTAVCNEQTFYCNGTTWSQTPLPQESAEQPTTPSVTESQAETTLPLETTTPIIADVASQNTAEQSYITTSLAVTAENARLIAETRGSVEENSGNIIKTIDDIVTNTTNVGAGVIDGAGNMLQGLGNLVPQPSQPSAPSPTCTLIANPQNIEAGDQISYTIESSAYGYSAFWKGSENGQPTNYQVEDFSNTNYWTKTYTHDTPGTLNYSVEILNDAGETLCTTNPVEIRVTERTAQQPEDSLKEQQTMDRFNEANKELGIDITVSGDLSNPTFSISTTSTYITTTTSGSQFLFSTPKEEQKKFFAESKKRVDNMVFTTANFFFANIPEILVNKAADIVDQYSLTTAVCQKAGVDVLFEPSYREQITGSIRLKGQTGLDLKQWQDFAKAVNPSSSNPFSEDQIEQSRQKAYELIKKRLDSTSFAYQSRLDEVNGMNEEQAKQGCTQAFEELIANQKELADELQSVEIMLLAGGPINTAQEAGLKAAAPVVKPVVKKVTNPIFDATKKTWNSTIGRIFGGEGKKIRVSSDSIELAGKKVQTHPEFGELLSSGAYGAIYKGKDNKVTKIFTSYSGASAGDLNQIEVLKKAGGKYGLPKFYSEIVDESGRVGGFKMEYIDGVTFDKFIKGGGKLLVDEAYELVEDLIQIGKSTGLPHGDFHHNNILVQIVRGPDGKEVHKLRIIDYGGVDFSSWRPDQIQSRLQSQVESAIEMLFDTKGWYESYLENGLPETAVNISPESAKTLKLKLIGLSNNQDQLSAFLQKEGRGNVVSERGGIPERTNENVGSTKVTEEPKYVVNASEGIRIPNIEAELNISWGEIRPEIRNQALQTARRLSIAADEKTLKMIASQLQSGLSEKDIIKSYGIAQSFISRLEREFIDSSGEISHARRVEIMEKLLNEYPSLLSGLAFEFDIKTSTLFSTLFSIRAAREPSGLGLKNAIKDLYPAVFTVVASERAKFQKIAPAWVDAEEAFSKLRFFCLRYLRTSDHSFCDKQPPGLMNVNNIHLLSQAALDRICGIKNAKGCQPPGDRIYILRSIFDEIPTPYHSGGSEVLIHECTHKYCQTLNRRAYSEAIALFPKASDIISGNQFDIYLSSFPGAFLFEGLTEYTTQQGFYLSGKVASIVAYPDAVTFIDRQIIPLIMKNSGRSRQEASAVAIEAAFGNFEHLYKEVGGGNKELGIQLLRQIIPNAAQEYAVANPEEAIALARRLELVRKLFLAVTGGGLLTGAGAAANSILSNDASQDQNLPSQPKPGSLLPSSLVSDVNAQEKEIGNTKIVSLNKYEYLAKQEAIKRLLTSNQSIDSLTLTDIMNQEFVQSGVSKTSTGYTFTSSRTGMVREEVEKGSYLVGIKPIPGFDIKVPEIIEIKEKETTIPISIKKGTGKIEKVTAPRGWQQFLKKLLTTVHAQEKKDSQVQMLVFSDTNNNGRIDKDEQVLPWAGLKVELKKVNQDRILSLNPGWNLVALEVLPQKPINASTLLQEIAKQGGYATTVSTLENGAWKSFVVRGDKTYSGDDFPVTPSKAYFVKALKSSVLVYQGQELVAPIKLNLASGWNGVGVPYSEKPYQAADFIDTLNTKGVGADTTSRWESGLWDTFVKLQDQGYGENFMIEQGRGYLLKVAKGLEFSP